MDVVIRSTSMAFNKTLLFYTGCSVVLNSLNQMMNTPLRNQISLHVKNNSNA